MSERRILFVCTANICRSPSAELLARARFGESNALFRSAGFLESGHKAPSDLRAILSARGIDATEHRSHRLDPETIEAAEIILTMEGRHVQEVAVRDGEALARTVPLKHAAELLEGRGLAALLNRLQAREITDYLTTKWDVDDPYRRGRRRYRNMVTEVDALVAKVVSEVLR